MTMQELEYYMDGFKIRDSLHKEGLRRIWVVLFNANVEKRYRLKGPRDISEAWPVYNDHRFIGNVQTEADEAEELRARYKELTKTIREQDGRGRPENSTISGSGPSNPIPE